MRKLTQVIEREGKVCSLDNKLVDDNQNQEYFETEIQNYQGTFYRVPTFKKFF